MPFDNFEPIEYKPITLYNVVFEVRFPDNLRIQSQRPVPFQEDLIKEGYTEYVQGSIPEPVGPIENHLPDDIRVFHFLTEQKDWDCALTRNSFGLTCLANYKNYRDFRERLQNILQIFCKNHTVPYFTRVGLMCQNMINSVFLPNLQLELQDFIPTHIFPVLNTALADDVLNLQTTSVFNDSEIRAVVTHSLFHASGIFGQKQVSNERSYTIEIDCSCERNIGVNINEILTQCDRFKELEWRIFQWSISESLQEIIGDFSA